MSVRVYKWVIKLDVYNKLSGWMRSVRLQVDYRIEDYIKWDIIINCQGGAP